MNSLNDAVSDGLSCAVALLRREWNVLVLGDTFSINDEVILDLEPWILLVVFVQLGRWVPTLTGKCDQIAWLAALRRHQKLHSTLIWCLAAENHTVRGESTK